MPPYMPYMRHFFVSFILCYVLNACFYILFTENCVLSVVSNICLELLHTYIQTHLYCAKIVETNQMRCLSELFSVIVHANI